MMKILFPTLALCLLLSACSKAEDAAEIKPKAVEPASETQLQGKGDPLSTPGASNGAQITYLDKIQMGADNYSSKLATILKQVGGQEASLVNQHMLEWNKVSGDASALYRLEQMLSTLETPTDKQKMILASHYFYVAQGCLGAKSTTRLLSKAAPPGEELWSKMRGDLDNIEDFCRKRCEQLAPDYSKGLIKAAAK